MHGRGLLLVLSFLVMPSFVLAQGSGASKDDFAEFEELPEPSKDAEKPTIDVPVKELEATPLSTLPEDSKPEVAKPEEPKVAEPEKPAEPQPLPTTPEPEPPPTVKDVPPEKPPVSEEPDLAKEAKFFDIYRKYNLDPVDERFWRARVQASKKQVYVIQPGDTLSDVSKTLFDDINIWPKIWATNTDVIMNPHEIEPGMKLKFFPGTITELPVLTLSETKTPGAQPSVVDEGPPPPTRISRRLKKVPDSLPLYRWGSVNRPKPQVVVDDMTKDIREPLIIMNHYLEEGSPSYIGEIIESEQGSLTAVDFEYVIVHLNDPSTIKLVYATKEVDAFKVPGSRDAAEVKIMELQGELEILEKVDPDKNYYRARVVRTVTSMLIGAKLMPGRLPRGDVRETEIPSGIEANIIGGSENSIRRLYGPGEAVYIDGGVAQGIREGQTYNIFTNLKNRNPNSVVEYKNRQIGKLKILRTTENFSTAYILQVDEDIWKGDKIGGATQVAVATPKPSVSSRPSEEIIIPESEDDQGK